MKLYKLTDQKGRTRAGEKNETQWGDGITHEPLVKSNAPELCGPTVIHACTDPLLALILNSEHANIYDPILWECEGDIVVDGGDKCGCTRLTTIRQIEQPALSTQTRVAFAIFCARQVYHDPSWSTWADNWLSGKDRTNAYSSAYIDNDAGYVARITAVCAAATARTTAVAVRVAAAVVYAANATTGNTARKKLIQTALTDLRKWMENEHAHI